MAPGVPDMRKNENILLNLAAERERGGTFCALRDRKRQDCMEDRVFPFSVEGHAHKCYNKRSRFRRGNCSESETEKGTPI